MSIGVATTEKRFFSHPEEVVGVATELKEFAKRSPGSGFAFDRRGSPGKRKRLTEPYTES
jgi:hypothetical protein